MGYMGWNSTTALLGFTFLGLGSLAYLLLKESESGGDRFSSKAKVVRIKIPRNSIGIVIGTGGNTIKEIESIADVKINIDEEHDECNDYRICIVKGTPEATQLAESLIHERIVNQPLIETYEMLVPAQAYSKIIGKNSSNIRLISRNSNTKITIENTSTSPVSLEKKIFIKGTSEQIALAKYLVEQKVKEHMEFQKQIETQVPNRSTRSRSKYILPAKGVSEETNLETQKPIFVETGSNGLLEVYISALESPERLWLQMLGPCTVELDRLVEQMTDYYTKEENLNLHKLRDVKCGQIVAAPFTYDDKWYRAEVLEISNDDSNDSEIVLHYVDYGDTASCKKTQVCELRTDFLRLRFQAVECMLAKIKPRDSSWSAEASEFLADLIHVALWKSLTARIHTYKERPTRRKREGSPIPCIELFDAVSGKTIDVAEELVKKGFAVWETESSGPAKIPIGKKDS